MYVFLDFLFRYRKLELTATTTSKSSDSPSLNKVVVEAQQKAVVDAQQKRLDSLKVSSHMNKINIAT